MNIVLKQKLNHVCQEEGPATKRGKTHGKNVTVMMAVFSILRALFTKHDSEPVSYTHLDVYKRQADFCR